MAHFSKYTVQISFFTFSLLKSSLDQLENGDGITIIKDGACHRLIIDCCKKGDAAVYRFEAEGRKSEAALNIQGQKSVNCSVSLLCLDLKGISF